MSDEFNLAKILHSVYDETNQALKISGGGSSPGVTTLGGLTDVTLVSPADGDTLTYNGSVWVNNSGVTVDISNNTTNITALETEQLDFQIDAVTGETYKLSLSATYGYDVDNLICEGETGTTVLSLAIEGTEITGIDSVSITTTESTNTASAANSVAVGETLTLIVETGVNQILYGSIKITRA